MKRRIISAIISVAMILSALPAVSVLADDLPSWMLFSESFDAESTSYRVVNTKSLLSARDGDNNIFGYWDVNGGDFHPVLAGGALKAGWCGDRKPTVMLKNPITIESGHDIVIDTRVRYNASGSYIKSDGIAIADGGNPLFNIMGSGADNYTRGLIIAEPGNGNTLITGGGYDGTTVTSDMHLQNNTWYNISIKVSNNGGEFTYTISDDNNNIYTSPTLKPVSAISSIQYIQLAYGAFTDTFVDYINIYDVEDLGVVEIINGENDEPLDTQVDVPTTFEATIVFDNPITEDDLASISVSNGANFTVEAIDENFAVISFTGLKNSSSYTVHIPMLGGNRASDISFKTVAAEWAMFDESFDTANSTYAIVNTKAALNQSDSDGNNFGHFDINGEPYHPTVSGGNLNVGYCGNVKPAIMLYKAVPLEQKGLVINTRVKYKAENGYKEEDGTLKITNGNNPLFNIIGTGSNYATNGILFSLENGNVSAGNGGNQEVSDFVLKDQTWYNFTIIIDGTGKTFKYTVADDNGNKYTSGTLNSATTLPDLRYIQLAYGAFTSTTVDYVNVSKMGSVEVINDENDEALNGQTDVSTELTATVFFENPVAANDLSKITVNNDAQMSVTAVDENSATITLSGLENATTYTIHIPMLGGNAPADVSFVTKAPQWILFSDEFDTDPVAYRMVNTKALLAENDSDQNIFGDYLNATVSGGTLNVPYGGNVKPTIMFKKVVPLTQGKDLLIETRVKYKANSKDEDGTIHISDGNNPLFNIMGAGADNYTKGIMIITDANGVITSGNGGNQESTGILLKDQTWYNIAIKLNGTGKTYTLTVSDDSGNKYTTSAINCASTLSDIRYVQLAYGGFAGTTLDYLNITDASLIPVPEATFGKYNDSIDGAGNVRPGDIVTVKSKSEMTADSIKLDNNAVTAELSQDAKTAVFTVPALVPRTKHTLTVDDTEFNFRAADEAKYMYRAEFDGNDDDTVWYLSLNANKYSVENNSTYVKDGVFTSTYGGDHQYRAFMPIFKEVANETFITKSPRASQQLDCTGKKNVIIETRFKLGEGTVDDQFMYLGDNIALLKVDSNRVLRYDAVAGTEGTPFTVYDDDFVLEPDRWYSLSMAFDFVAQKYQISVDDGNGNIANSGVLSFIYNHKKYEISDFRFARMLRATDAPLSIDYFRIIDADYGKVDVTYNDGIALEGSALIKDGDVFNFTSINTPQNLDSITLVDEDGNDVAIEVEADGNDVTIFPSGFEYNTKYTLNIPAEVTGAESEQNVLFTTAYDENAEFAYPAGYSAEDELNVVYFGGSITNQEGWRVYSTNWFKEHFPNANCYNASIGGTGAEYGWIRLNRDVISKDPDIVFVEYAVNDSANTQTAKYMESIVRNLNALEKPPVIIFVYTTVLNFDTNTYAMAEHERIARAYGIQSISIHDYVRSLYNTDAQFASDWDAKNYLPDSTHPSTSGATNGSKVYGDYVNAVMTSDCAKYLVKPLANSAVTPLTEYKNYVYNYDNVDLTLTDAGDSFEYDFEGDELIIDVARNSAGGRFKVEVDGEVKVASAETYVQSGPPMPVRVTDLGEGKHNVVITVLNDATTSSHNVKINSILTKGDELIEEKTVFGNIEFDLPTVTEGRAVNASVKYTANSSIPVTMVLAFYDETGALTGLTTVSSTTDATGTEKAINVSATPKTGEVSAKAFLWNSLTQMQSLTDAVSIGE